LRDLRPARAAFAVAALPMGALVEIEAWAWVGGQKGKIIPFAGCYWRRK
jgi:hypothetical protein